MKTKHISDISRHFVQGIGVEKNPSVIIFAVIFSGKRYILKNHEVCGSGERKITGFVDDVTKYFANSMCFVAPLLLGAGIKVKILEAMSSGIPVLTNSIGIEGIPAVDGVNYIHCESAEDYIRYIDKIYKDPKQYDEIGLNGRKLINERINLSDGIDTLVREVLQ